MTTKRPESTAYVFSFRETSGINTVWCATGGFVQENKLSCSASFFLACFLQQTHAFPPANTSLRQLKICIFCLKKSLSAQSVQQAGRIALVLPSRLQNRTSAHLECESQQTLWQYSASFQLTNTQAFVSTITPAFSPLYLKGPNKRLHIHKEKPLQQTLNAVLQNTGT